MTELSVGKRLRSQTYETEVIVIRAPQTPVELCCGDHPMTSVDAARGVAATVSADHGVVLGKRYVGDETGLEVLCTKAGTGPLVADGRQLAIKAAKALPASD